MDKNGNNVNNCSKDKSQVVSVDSEKDASNGDRDKDNEAESLLPRPNGGLSKKSGKPGRKVRWNDENGNKLAEVVEFQPRRAECILLNLFGPSFKKVSLKSHHCDYVSCQAVTSHGAGYQLSAIKIPGILIALEQCMESAIKSSINVSFSILTFYEHELE
ncbi:hypothetical protein Acr_08g0015130 [Actinidia rufa]|uniref:Uncharacterized protein n=1 Tax=Actinidia rufa TaxID=165716 RepID=A0A7J0F5A5_9ERIC|nr:hypothetical protein Acr_08g0015130 [Actinidia rufa]